MSLAAIRPFFRERLEALGYEEHDQPFEPNEIGANIVDGSFHLEVGVVSSFAANQRDHEFSFPITIRVYRTEYSCLNEGYDAIFGEADTVLDGLLVPSVRLNSGLLRDIVPNSVQVRALDSTNDNVIVLELAFTARLLLCFEDN